MQEEFIEKQNDNGFRKLLDSVKANNFSAADTDRVIKAYELASSAHEGQKRRSGEPYIIHPVAVAQILADMCMDTDSICAALLHDVVEDTEYTSEQIREMFGETIEQLVDGVTKLGQISVNASREEQQNENVRKMFLAMSKDIRVIIIKLADRVHNMRTLRFMPEEKRRYKARETLEIYAPIAHRLGIRAFKEELEDLAISFLDPVAYKEIANTLETQVESRQTFLQSIKDQIGERVLSEVPNAHISGRIKSVHGIYRKTYMQGRTIDEIYDIYAVRIIVDSVFECYYSLGIIHDMYNPLPGRFKDYISTPKPNMYQSLHTTVIGKEGIPFEVQIRTWEMHQTAEYGIAAHWKYKLGIGGKVKFEERLSWIRQLLENQKESDDVEEIVNVIKNDFASEEVFAFTPKGDVICLPVGSTIVDFAYAIHSAVGSKMIGAKVNSRITTLDHQIANGEIIEILTSSHPKGPSRDWLKLAKTSSARSKIKSWFKKERREENIVEGKAEVEREFKRSNITLPEKQMEEFLLKIAEKEKCNTIDDLYAAIGYGGISLMRILPKIRDMYTKLLKELAPPEETPVVITQPKKVSKTPEGIVIEGIDNCLVKFSHCCDPLPGDDIIGFITRGHGVSIHTRKCTNVPKDIASCAEPERWIKASWADKVESSYRATLTLTCLDRVGLLADLSGQLATMHVMIHSLLSKESKDGRCVILMTITVNGAEHLNSVKERLKKVKGVLLVERSGM
ncbi:MAG: bifunctional (p)ppGpp synthetase/guanosine-3',5'-bis(diphosphate) 3'-pyrophosphohydrolase [Faecalibacterium sp.]|nr:bifunctional (p)ppGpp synthetase/guanosine-3',5'-bis(diphosphate) 3'-pyrophosphohydrolase [Ruminococcus sp.]MCM1391413.1 bifunctional (p)ppGpp synthetase/guanosine-3',5'-bis(diphosphate) 3'-pyrophosphohydrolase [Ruminococcus sp.]MCM1485087.1 bifunctional (p)ppGpp synthetase/guanosine-3',5'-bis(diphosphate) 3'-pyrophosphohydrolase [Faecalibacterium sp.]